MLRQLERRIRADGAREGADARHSCRARSRCAPTGACCGGCCRTSSRTRSSTRRRAGCWSAAAGAATRLRIDVYDTGLGIPQAKRRDVFKEFHRLDQGARVARGLGLGPVDRRAHRARARPPVALQSRLGRGSRFSVEVPLAPAVAGAARPEPRDAHIEAGQLTGMRRCSCIDNEPAILDGMRTLLGGWGCRVLTATDLARRAPRSTAASDRARRSTGRLSPRRRQRHRGDRGVARPLRRAICRPSSITADRSPQVREEARASASRSSTSRSSRPRCARCSRNGGSQRRRGGVAASFRGATKREPGIHNHHPPQFRLDVASRDYGFRLALCALGMTTNPHGSRSGVLLKSRPRVRTDAHATEVPP